LSAEAALLFSALLIGAVLVALFSKSVSVSLMGLFYASIALGLIFTLYGSILIGLLEIITFAGTVSVLLLTAILMTGESKLDIHAGRTKITFLGMMLAVVAVASLAILSGLPTSTAGASTISPSDLFVFVWQFRPWDLLILLVVFGSAMVVVTNLFSKEAH
jgi:NADH:ubiquinone oxidoreductase subunit 6 (subunit J)